MRKDPHELSRDEFADEVRIVVRGAITLAQAEERLKKHFSPQPLFWVQAHGEHHFGVLAQQHAGAESINILCER